MASTSMAQGRQQELRAVFMSASDRILSQPSISGLGAEEIVAISKKMGVLLKQFQDEHSSGAVPSEQATLFWLGLKLTGTPAEQAVRDLLSGEAPAPTFQLQRPALLGEEGTAQSSVTPATRPRRVSSVPTIDQLRSQRYTNIIDVRLDEENKIYRFASNDPNLDLVGMTRQQLIDYAKEQDKKYKDSGPDEQSRDHTIPRLQIFEVNERGYATKRVDPSSL